jgi:hypothetical protein
VTPTGGGFVSQTQRDTQAAQRGANIDVAKAGAIENIQTQGARSVAFNKILDDEIRPAAAAGDTVSGIRKQQFQMFERPGVDANKIFGIANGAGRSATDQSWTIVRDILTGEFKGQSDGQLSKRLQALGLTPEEQSALAEYQQSVVAINAANLRAVAGPGAVSDAEQKINREAGLDPTVVPGLAAYNIMSRSQFDADRARYKAEFALNSRATNALELDRDWRRESSRLGKIYTDIARERSKFISDQGGSYAAVKEGYKRFPIPEYDVETGTWKKIKPLGQILGK